MSRGERAVLEARIASGSIGPRPLTWTPHADPALVVLEGQPCPFLAGDGHTCQVYDDRPMNCRRFRCYRATPTEPLLVGGPLGCYNALDRFEQSAAVQADYHREEQIAQVWGWRHGWPAK